MRLIRSLDATVLDLAGVRRVLTIGAFDGLHLGHQTILRRALALAEQQRERLTMLSFEPTPAEFFAHGEPPARLTRLRERFELLNEFGIDELCCPPFRHINQLGDREFVDTVLVDRLGVSHVVIGHDFRYGSGRSGTVDTLRAAGREHGFGVTVVDAVFLAGERVSSTAIRTALQGGDLAAARAMLGRDYSMSGRVVHGLGLGRGLGFATANVNLKRRRAPVDGIFAVQVDGLGPLPRDGVASIGNRPTVGGGKTLLEVHLFDFDEDIYGRYITVRFRHRLRAEEKFPTLAAMQTQMHADAAAARAALTG